MMTPRDKARQHARHYYFCTCGTVVNGNGGKASHAYKHERLKDGHHYLSAEAYRKLFPEKPR